MVTLVIPPPPDTRTIVQTYNSSIKRIRANVEGFVLKAWDSLDDYRDADIDRFVKSILPVMSGAESQVVALTDAYLSSLSSDALGKSVKPKGLSAKTLTGTALRGVDPTDVYKRAGVSVWAALSKGKSLDEAVSQGRNRIRSMVATDLQLAKTHAARAVFSQTEGIAGYKRVVFGKTCVRCSLASQNLYKRGDLLPIHPGCDCGVLPVFEGLELDEFLDSEPEAGRLTREQYEAMQPASQWSEEKRKSILSALRTDDNGKILAETLDRFQDGGSIARLRTVIEKRLAGESLDPTSLARADAMIDALRHALEDLAPDKLFRGMNIKGKLSTVLGKYKPGDTLDLNITSFSTDRAAAKRFQMMTGKAGSTRVMVELVGEGKRLIPIQNLARDSRLFKEKEWVGGGKFQIVEVKKSPDGGVIVRIKQIGTL